ncbi:ubiquinol oxidase subunit II [Buchnera aphidicola]
MTCTKYRNIFKNVLFFLIMFFLNGCDSSLFNPKGMIAREELSLILLSFLMMLIVVLPVIFMTIYFSRKYRSSNKNQIYTPDWCDSKRIEIVVWSVPIIIISFLGLLTWHYSHVLAPNKSIQSELTPIKINVIALDWKWLFIYPEYHVATINEIVFPINRPVIFNITSNSVMNSFFIPALGSQVYAMPGMITQLNIISDTVGQYKGISSNYSGLGFSNMKFTAITVENDFIFKNWIENIQHSSHVLNNMDQFTKIAVPNENYSIQYFSRVNDSLFYQIINQFHIHKFP